MELLAQLESRFEALSRRVKELEQENQALKGELERERKGRGDVQARIESLLKKVESELG